MTLGLAALLIGLVLPDTRRRRRVAGVFARAFFRSAAIPLRIEGRERLPRGPCVVVANHASYIDGVVAAAALPAEFAFVIKKEMARVPLASLLLRRLGSEFVERHDRNKGAADARRVLRTAAAGQSLVFFPEGTFTAEPRIGAFQRGAFATAERAGLPVVAVAIHGTRAALPCDVWRLRRVPLTVEVLAVIDGDDARRLSREMIAAAIGEPLAERAR